MAKEQTSHAETHEVQRVSQPEKVKGISAVNEVADVAELVMLLGNISERIEKHHEQYAGSQGGQGTQGDDDAQPTPRDELLKKLPAAPFMQQQLERHIHEQISLLKKDAARIRKNRKPGWAYEMNLLFAKIRRFTALARQIVRASAEVLKKFYILVFIDRQSIDTQK